jgi:hypothetical protein
MGALEPGKARISHPDPGVEDAIVDAIQVPHFEHAGWRYVEGDREDWPPEAREESRAGWVYIRNRSTGGTTFVPELTAALAERGWEEVDPEAERAAELEDKTVAELRELAKGRGISPIPTTKAELLEALQKFDKGSPLPSGVTEVVNRTGEPERVEPVQPQESEE